MTVLFLFLQVNDGTLDGLSKRCERIQRLNLSWCGKGATLQNSTFGRLDMFSRVLLPSCIFTNVEHSLMLVKPLLI